MRGKVEQREQMQISIRITPAYAGKRPKDGTAKKADGGSPPPMRGKVVDSEVSLCRYGITPAYAGKSRF